MLINFLVLHSDRTEVLVRVPHVAKSKCSDYIVTLDGLLFTSCAEVTSSGFCYF